MTTESPSSQDGQGKELHKNEKGLHASKNCKSGSFSWRAKSHWRLRFTQTLSYCSLRETFSFRQILCNFLQLLVGWLVCWLVGWPRAGSRSTRSFSQAGKSYLLWFVPIRRGLFYASKDTDRTPRPIYDISWSQTWPIENLTETQFNSLLAIAVPSNKWRHLRRSSSCSCSCISVKKVAWSILLKSTGSNQMYSGQ